MYIYALIDANGICAGFIESESEINSTYYVLVSERDETMVYRKKWDAETQTWVDTEPTEVNAENSRRLTHTDDDGTGSGLDADTLDGLEASAFAAAEHTHDGYAASTHTHDGYAAADHSHSGYAATEHTHDGYAASDHTHSGYAASNHSHSDYASSDHTHSQSDISGLATALAGKASSSHTHSEYAAASHTHSDYFEKTGGEISGETNFTGGLVRTKGTQTLYNSGSQITLASKNLPTNICGSAIYSNVAITVSSDRRLKDDVRHVNKEAFVDFIKKINLVSYRYKEEPADTKHIGVIAQQLLEINKDLASYFVCEDRDGYYSVDYAALALVAAAVALQ